VDVNAILAHVRVLIAQRDADALELGPNAILTAELDLGREAPRLVACIETLHAAIEQAIAILEEEELPDVQGSPAERAYVVLVESLKIGGM